jgi:hypothetical protein
MKNTAIFFVIIFTSITISACVKDADTVDSPDLSPLVQNDTQISYIDSTSQTQDQQDTNTQQPSPYGVFYINKNTDEEAILGTDPEELDKNYYKYKDILVTFELKNPEQIPEKRKIYDIVINQNGKKDVLIPDVWEGFYEEINTLNTTKIPYIIDNPSGFGDAGIYSSHHAFINLLNRSQISIGVSNTDESLPQTYLNEIFSINKDRFTLVNKDLINACLSDETSKEKGLQIDYLLKNDVKTFKLPKPAIMDCSQDDYSLLSNDSFQFVGLDKDFGKVYFVLGYYLNNPLSSDTNTNDITFEFSIKNGDLKIVNDDSWQKDNIINEI